MPPRPATRSVSRKMRLLSYSGSYTNEEFPTELQNMMNNLPPSHKKDPNHRFIFESMILSNTVDEEPKAPIITIANHVDDEPCPPFSFYYTNKLYCGPGTFATPDPYEKGCSCKGPCDPDNPSCSCARRQEAMVTGVRGFEDHKGFLYNEDGSIKDHGLPIFECNAMCRCSDNCVNRVS